MPEHTSQICSPFFGGGSIELACASRGMEVVGWDHFSPLVAFWQELITDAHGLAERVRRYYPLSREAFYTLQRQFRGMGKELRAQPREKKPRGVCQKEWAAAFYVLNRASFSGTTLSGGMSPGHPRFTPRSIDKLVALDVSNLKVAHADFRDSIPQCPAESLLYLDPPYANGEALYGIGGDMHIDFPHNALADMLRKRPRWILSYNDCAEVRALYRGFKMVTPSWAYGMSTDKSSRELLIFSEDLSRESELEPETDSV